MKLLVIGSRIPYPLNDGGAIATFNMLKGLATEGHTITYLSLNTNKHHASPAVIEKHFNFLHSVIPFDINTDVRPVPAFLNLFSRQSYNIQRFKNKGFDALLKKTIQDNAFDIIHFEGLFTAPYIDTARQFSNAPAILRQHNVEFRIWEKLAEETSNRLKKNYIRLLARRLKQFETSVVSKFNAIVCIAATDTAEMQNWPGIPSLRTIHTGFEIPETPVISTFIPGSVYHIGSMEWMPNRQAMEWFHSAIWPLAESKNNTINFHMAGKNMPELYKQWQTARFNVYGEVSDAATFSADKQILAVPLLSASGIRIKTIEAMLQGKPVVTTTPGAAGLPLENGKHCLIADTAETFANALLLLCSDHAKAMSMVAAARELMTKNFELKSVSAEWTAFYQSMLNR